MTHAPPAAPRVRQRAPTSRKRLADLDDVRAQRERRTAGGAANQSPVAGQAIAGLVSAGVGALLYALSCPDDSPFFIATRYSLAIAIVTGATAYVGNRLLRW